MKNSEVSPKEVFESITNAPIWTAPLLPLNNAVLFPGTMMPAVIVGDQAKEAIEAALKASDKSLIVTSLRPGSNQKKDMDQGDIYQIGTKAIISRMTRLEEGISIYLTGVERVKITKVNEESSYLIGDCVSFPVLEISDPETEALQREILKTFDEMKLNSKTEAGLPISELINNVPNRLQQIYLIAIVIGLKVDQAQKLLEANTIKELSKLTHDYISYEFNVEKLRGQISEQVANELAKEQREYVLRRQLTEIQKELGEGSSREQVQDLEEQMIKNDLPKGVLEEGLKQLKRLTNITDSSPEYQVIYSYVKSLIELPWNKKTEDNLDLYRAEEILDHDHYDLKEVKERIIEHLAVLKLNKVAKAPILCFVGPPGVGKTSLGQSIARSLDRKFERMSLGGMHDEAEIRGHRRTYIGAMPGRIMESIRRAGVNNPLIMLDEIDKMGIDFHGDPSSALMEVLDPTQNFAFHDNYLDVPFDLSHVFFITTANTAEKIPKPLLDRMEVLNLAGYADYEKVEIAKRHLIQKELVDSGVKPTELSFLDNAILGIIHDYTREAGVRELQRLISKIVRKVATKIAKGDHSPEEVSSAKLETFLGHPKIFMEKVRSKWSVGISTGLAWTETGGDIIYIESLLLPNRKNEIKITGNVGEIMRESVTCALSNVLSNPEFNKEFDQFKDFGVHVHIPSGAIPKDGPSAGIAIAVALTSLFIKRPVRKDLAMTGEITLSGVILAVGGIKEKVLAAHRAGIHELLLPQANLKDLDEVPDQVRREIKFNFVSDISEVLGIALPGTVV